MSKKGRSAKEEDKLKGLGALARERGCPRVAVELLYWIERMIDAARLQLDRIAESRSKIGYPDTVELERNIVSFLAYSLTDKYPVLNTLVTDVELLFTCVARIDNSLRKGLLKCMGDPKVDAIYSKYEEAFREKTDIRNHLEHMDERVAREMPPIYVSQDDQGIKAFEGVNYDIGHLRGKYYLVGGRWIDTSPEAFAFIDELRQDLREWLISLEKDTEAGQREQEERTSRTLSVMRGHIVAAADQMGKQSKRKKSRRQ